MLANFFRFALKLFLFLSLFHSIENESGYPIGLLFLTLFFTFSLTFRIHQQYSSIEWDSPPFLKTFLWYIELFWAFVWLSITESCLNEVQDRGIEEESFLSKRGVFKLVLGALFLCHNCIFVFILTVLSLALKDDFNENSFSASLKERYDFPLKFSEKSTQGFVLKNKEELESVSLFDFEEEIVKSNFSQKDFEGEEDDLCSICIQNLAENKSELLSFCNAHFFHCECLLGWLRVRPLCPLCKSGFREILLALVSFREKQKNGLIAKMEEGFKFFERFRI